VAIDAPAVDEIGIEIDADCPATNTVSNRATAAWSVKPRWVVTTTWKPSGAAV